MIITGDRIKQEVTKCKDTYFVKGDLLHLFKKDLPVLGNNITVYILNSDETFDDIELLNSPQIKKVYAQNLNIIHKKAQLLPIGCANEQYVHGNLDIVSEVMNKPIDKSKDLYVNMDMYTFLYRKTIMEIFDLQGYA